MFDFSVLNWLAIAVVTVAGFVLGAIYYGPMFGHAWLKAIGKSEDELGGTVCPMAISFLGALCTAICFSLLTHALGLTAWTEGLAFGAIVGVGFITTAMASDYAFCGYRFELWLIQSGYRVVYSLLMGAVLAAWR